MLPRMGVSVSVLASGSRGNCAIVCSSSTRILVDAGISCRETFKRMKATGDDPRMLSAVLITHEHSDHVYGLRILARKLSVPIFMTGAAHQAWTRSMREETGEKPEVAKLETFFSGRSFQIGDIAVTPFTIPHDAADPVGFTFRAEGIKVGIATDRGCPPPNVCDHLRGSDPAVVSMSQCIDPIVGKILAGWRYDISGLAPEMRGDYEEHFAACERCRSKQRLHRTIDVSLIALASVSAGVFLLAFGVIRH